MQFSTKHILSFVLLITIGTIGYLYYKEYKVALYLEPVCQEYKDEVDNNASAFASILRNYYKKHGIYEKYKYELQIFEDIPTHYLSEKKLQLLQEFVIKNDSLYKGPQPEKKSSFENLTFDKSLHYHANLDNHLSQLIFDEGYLDNSFKSEFENFHTVVHKLSPDGKDSLSLNLSYFNCITPDSTMTLVINGIEKPFEENPFQINPASNYEIKITDPVTGQKAIFR